MKLLIDGLRILGILMVVYVLVVLFALQEASLTRNFERERAAQHALLGTPASLYVETQAHNLFTALAVNSGAMKQSFQGAQLPAPAAKPSAADGASRKISGWLEQRMRVIWTVVFYTMVRGFYALLWWPVAVLIIGPVMVDAIASRKIQATTFALTSPLMEGFVMRVLPLLLAGYFLMLFMPFYEPPWTVPLLLVLTGYLVWLGVIEFAKRG
jgi:hypothetical protein